MTGPWENYQAPSGAPPDGPWAKYGQQPDAAPAPSLLSRISDVGRQLGLTARAAVNGVAALPAMAADAVTGPINAALDYYDDHRAPTASELVTGKQKGYRFKQQAPLLDHFLTEMGLPEPQNATERVVQGMSSGVAGAATGAGLGGVLAKASNPVVQSVGDAMAAGRGLQAVSGATGAGAAGIARENGVGPVGQAAAGLAGGLAPALVPAATGAAVRAALRGGEEGRQSVQRVVQAFDAAGAQPTVGQATGNKLIQGVESGLAKVPGGAGVMQEVAERQSAKLQEAVQQLSNDLAPTANSVSAGEAIQRGIKAFKDGFKVEQRDLYNTLGRELPKDTPIDVSRTAEVLANMNADIEGAPALSAWFKNAKIQGIEGALQEDLRSASPTTGAYSGLGVAPQPVTTLPYEAIKKLRTLVGDEITDGSILSDVPRSKWQQLYGALTDDLGAAAKAAGPKAEAAWNAANDYTRQHMQRLDELSSIVSRDAPEKVFQAAISGTGEGGTVINRVMSALPAPEKSEVAAAVLQRLGRATPGQQNAMGDAFSSETFLTNLSKMSSAARDALFGHPTMNGALDQLENFAQIAASRREAGKYLANPSGTARATAQIGLASGIGTGAVMAAGGHPTPLMAALAVPAGAWGLAKVATGQYLVDKAMTQAALPQGTEAAVLNSATHIGDHGAAPEKLLERMPRPDAPASSASAIEPKAEAGAVTQAILNAPTLDAAIEATKALPDIKMPQQAASAATLASEAQLIRRLAVERRRARLLEEMARMGVRRAN
jgi:hypothetical protein